MRPLSLSVIELDIARGGPTFDGRTVHLALHFVPQFQGRLPCDLNRGVGVQFAHNLGHQAGFDIHRGEGICTRVQLAADGAGEGHAIGIALPHPHPRFCRPAGDRLAVRVSSLYLEPDFGLEIGLVQIFRVQHIALAVQDGDLRATGQGGAGR